mmetsp:Transcript_28702/g.42508  ORF Transcript_28702/g.42508 Transcript_28702/m.42508 type:complete len:137 (+) Transcript_28702:362-772(+)
MIDKWAAPINKKTGGNIQGKAVSGYIYRYGKSKEVNAKLFFRGIRTWEKDGKDERYLHYLNNFTPVFADHYMPIPTVFIEGDPRYNSISSTVVRNLCNSMKGQKDGGKDGNDAAELSKLVPDIIRADVVEAYASQK